jgi:EAL domain-containing protein (putative c-di-GMP-specific phosphodiesterase class I)
MKDLASTGYSHLATYREMLAELREGLVQEGSLGLLLVDASELAQVERDYGSKAFESVLSTTSELVADMRGVEIRQGDVVALDERGGHAFLIFLSPRRGTEEARGRVAHLAAAAERVEEQLNRKLSRLASPYLGGRRRVAVGFSLVFANPLVLPERLISRLVEEAWEAVRIQRAQTAFQNRSRVQEVLLGEHITTLFQPIHSLQGEGILGFEALSRGPRGTPLANPANLFAAAAEADLVFELDRQCRRRAIAAARDLPPGAKLFVNVFPAAMYDPDFQGAALIRLMEGLGFGPERIVLEISEKYAIENYTLFVEALQNFTQMGFSIAVDDIGAGYSGLEKMARLRPKYLKFDMLLVRDIDASYIQREMARALKVLAGKMDASIIAEGIERDGELRTLAELGIEYGQGYLLGRPGEAAAPKAPAPAAGESNGSAPEGSNGTQS